MKLGSRPVIIAAAVAVLALAAAAYFLTRPPGEETCFDRLGGPGPNSNTSRLDTFVDIPADQWPALARILSRFGAERGWLVNQGDGRDDPTYKWLDMCDAVTFVRASNEQGAGPNRMGFGIIHMNYDGPASDAWQPIYRELHRRIEARWPGRLSYIEGEFGQRIGRPEWVDPPAAAVAAPDDQPEGNAAR